MNEALIKTPLSSYHHGGGCRRLRRPLFDFASDQVARLGHTAGKRNARNLPTKHLLPEPPPLMASRNLQAHLMPKFACKLREVSKAWMQFALKPGA